MDEIRKSTRTGVIVGMGGILMGSILGGAPIAWTSAISAQLSAVENQKQELEQDVTDLEGAVDVLQDALARLQQPSIGMDFTWSCQATGSSAQYNLVLYLANFGTVQGAPSANMTYFWADGQTAYQAITYGPVVVTGEDLFIEAVEATTDIGECAKPFARLV